MEDGVFQLQGKGHFRFPPKQLTTLFGCCFRFSFCLLFWVALLGGWFGCCFGGLPLLAILWQMLKMAMCFSKIVAFLAQKRKL
jgi:hypothetical protein